MTSYVERFCLSVVSVSRETRSCDTEREGQGAMILFAAGIFIFILAYLLRGEPPAPDASGAELGGQIVVAFLVIVLAAVALLLILGGSEAIRAGGGL